MFGPQAPSGEDHPFFQARLPPCVLPLRRRNDNAKERCATRPPDVGDGSLAIGGSRVTAILNADGYNVVVYPAGRGWSVRVSNRLTKKFWRVAHVLVSMHAAKLTVFDV